MTEAEDFMTKTDLLNEIYQQLDAVKRYYSCSDLPAIICRNKNQTERLCIRLIDNNIKFDVGLSGYSGFQKVILHPDTPFNNLFQEKKRYVDYLRKKLINNMNHNSRRVNNEEVHSKIGKINSEIQTLACRAPGENEKYLAYLYWKNIITKKELQVSILRVSWDSIEYLINLRDIGHENILSELMLRKMIS